MRELLATAQIVVVVGIVGLGGDLVHVQAQSAGVTADVGLEGDHLFGQAIVGSVQIWSFGHRSFSLRLAKNRAIELVWEEKNVVWPCFWVFWP